MSAPLAEHVATEVRAELARQQKTGADLARLLGVTEMWVSRRIRGNRPMDLVDLELIADALGIPVSQLIPEPARTGRDSVSGQSSATGGA